MSTERERLERKLEQLKEQRIHLEAEWERNVRFAGPAAPNKRLNRCLDEIRRTIEKILEQ